VKNVFHELLNLILVVITLSDIASSQAAHMKRQEEDDKQEIVLLQAAIKDLQMHDDTKLIMGQLHQHILLLQKSENYAKKEAVGLKEKTLRLEKIILQVCHLMGL
jgi:centrosomal protein CEP290